MFLDLPDLHRGPLFRGKDPRIRIRIRIRTKMSRIPNTCIFNPKNCYWALRNMTRDAYPGSGFFYPWSGSWIQGVKKALTKSSWPYCFSQSWRACSFAWKICCPGNGFAQWDRRLDGWRGPASCGLAKEGGGDDGGNICVYAVLRIHDILVWIRIRGSVPLSNGSGSGSKVLLHHFSKVKSQKEVTKQQKSRLFLLFLLNDRRIRIRSRIHTSD